MKICLINPPWIVKSGNIWKYIRSFMPPLGLLYLTAVLEHEKIDVDIIDYQASLSNWDKIEQDLKQCQYDVFGITSTTPIVNNGYRIARIIKKHHPHSKIVFGGVHATALPEEPFNKAPVDYVVRGEGEETLLGLLKGMPHAEIPGLSYKQGTQIYHIKPDGIVPDLDTLPYPAFHKIDLTKYKPAVGAYKRLPAINMMTTRGCLGRCTFCNSANVRLRKRSAEYIYLEMRMLAEKYGIREISFYDDTFTSYPRNVTRLCDLLIKNKIDLTWCCFARVDTVNYDMLKKMKAAGCHQVMYGIEAANRDILRNIKKRVDPEKNIKAVEMAKKAGLTVRCTFMFGNPGETEETMDETIRYSIQLDPDIALYNTTTPYPGTEMFDWAKQKGYLRTENWDNYDLDEPVMLLPTLSVEKIKIKHKQAFYRFYFRPKFIMRKLTDFLMFKDIPLYLEGIKSFYNFVKSNISKARQ